MHKHHGTAAVEFPIQRLVAVVAEIYASTVSFNGYSVAAQFVECEAELVERASHIRQRERGEVTEPPGVRARYRGPALINLPGEAACGGIIAKVGAG
jgi:hypothetical protein